MYSFLVSMTVSTWAMLKPTHCLILLPACLKTCLHFEKTAQKRDTNCPSATEAQRQSCPLCTFERYKGLHANSFEITGLKSSWTGIQFFPHFVIYVIFSSLYNLCYVNIENCGLGHISDIKNQINVTQEGKTTAFSWGWIMSPFPFLVAFLSHQQNTRLFISQMASLFLGRQCWKIRCFFLFQITEEKDAVFIQAD